MIIPPRIVGAAVHVCAPSSFLAAAPLRALCCIPAVTATPLRSARLRREPVVASPVVFVVAVDVITRGAANDLSVGLRVGLLVAVVTAGADVTRIVSFWTRVALRLRKRSDAFFPHDPRSAWHFFLATDGHLYITDAPAPSRYK